MIIAVILVTLLAGGFMFIASKPNEFSVQRSTVINTPAERVLEFLLNFHKWSLWSPWEKLEPTMEKKFSGAEEGIGAIYEWNGEKVGQGRMEIIEATDRKVRLTLAFLKPMKANNITEFILEPQDNGTKVTWIMSGTNNFMSKAMQTVMSMDGLVGRDFERGLADLKDVAEK